MKPKTKRGLHIYTAGRVTADDEGRTEPRETRRGGH
ncbi:hypothetical protein BVRB_6g156390 [Beta vulgaris subsp. vulgaris]|uniref:Uncharacterized protein n=1 Tax=Beta vulgaris subsp. vulgaris TaxID=3555 RepID=A0A0J8BBB1_BETVV|nr:hypothetical protein BVRB_6g156390 [Beta vulgaris subsp. vulgaris]